jgi:glycine cleavage system H protein
MIKIDEFEFLEDLYYDPKDHLWAKMEDGKVRVGLDMFGQKAAGTVAYVKLLPPGREVKKGRAFGSLEAGKYIGPLRSPVNGKILEVNKKVLDNPTIVNTDPYGDGWFVVIEMLNPNDLNDLVHGEGNIRAWLEREINEYKEKGLFPE